MEVLCRKGKNRHFDGVGTGSRCTGSRVYGEDSGGIGGAEVDALLESLSEVLGLVGFRVEADDDRVSLDSNSLREIWLVASAEGVSTWVSP